MSPFVAYHATRRACRDSIREHGLLPNRPAWGQPPGVYVFSEHILNNPYGMYRSRRTRWEWYGQGDLWQVAYIGPMLADRLVENAMILLGDVLPEMVTLVTGNDEY